MATDWKQADGRVVRVESIYPRGRRQLIVKFSYEVQGRLYEGELYTFESMHEGDLLKVKYDVSNPQLIEFQAKYKRTWRIWWFVMTTILGGAFLVMLWATAKRH
jgi:hypothetical protein